MLNIQGDLHSLDNSFQEFYYYIINYKLHVHKLISLKLIFIFF
jgi:hypothetical protein